MYEVDFSKPIHIHFIGIGGISMSGLAEILLKENFTISGSDAKESDLTRHLTSLGAQVFYGQKAENIIPGIDLVVYTAAIHPDNPEFAAAKAAGADPCRTAWTDHAQLQYADRRFRYPRKDDDNLHALPHSDGSRL